MTKSRSKPTPEAVSQENILNVTTKLDNNYFHQLDQLKMALKLDYESCIKRSIEITHTLITHILEGKIILIQSGDKMTQLMISELA